MLDRRQFAGLLAAAAAYPVDVGAQETPSLPFYASTGPDLTLYGLDVRRGTLTRRGATRLPGNVQYAWPHPSRKILYVISGHQGEGPPPPGDNHFLNAFRVGADGALTPHGGQRVLKYRPINVNVTHAGDYVLVAYNEPSHLTVHRLNTDGTLGDEVPQAGGLHFGIYAHQVRPTPGDKSVLMVTRGTPSGPNRPEGPGALELFGFADGKLANLQSLVPTGSGGLGFGPRHADFHPTLPFVYFSLERNNRMDVYRLNPDGGLSDQALFKKDTLSDMGKFRGIGPAAIHVHPNGRFVYVTNRGSRPEKDQVNGLDVSNGGPENIAVFAIDQKTGEPSMIQEIEAHGFVLRTFAIDPGGNILVAASTTPMLVRDGGKLDKVSAGLSVYRIGNDGKLAFLNKHDVDTSAGQQFWCGLLTMA